jgi:hypothetical protein
MDYYIFFNEQLLFYKIWLIIIANNLIQTASYNAIKKSTMNFIPRYSRNALHASRMPI